MLNKGKHAFAADIGSAVTGAITSACYQIKYGTNSSTVSAGPVMMKEDFVKIMEQLSSDLYARIMAAIQQNLYTQEEMEKDLGLRNK